jgi:FMN phosphatase YigB (HAD superfamily)
MVRALVFDLGGVLFSDGTEEFINRLHRAFGLDRTRSGRLLSGRLGSLYRQGRITRTEFWIGFRRALDLTASEDDLEAWWIDGYRLNEGTLALIRDLSPHYRLYYLSDNVAERVDAIERRYGFLRHFEEGVFSFEVGVRKPGIEIYEVLLEKTGVEARQVLYLDDKKTALVPAAQLGMRTLLFRDSEQVRQDLMRFGVLGAKPR